MGDNQPTLLGILVCGNEPEQYIDAKCQADCYVRIPHIRVGTAYSNAPLPEYPEELLRESINNAFAHRDYQSNRFVIVDIVPQESLSIRNPGAFERRQRVQIDTDYGKIRRIIPLQVARNPKLTHLLKSFRFGEEKGRGLTSLIDACLDNKIDVPYYIISIEEIKLVIKKGQVYDDEMTSWLDSFSGYIQDKISRNLTDDEKILLGAIHYSHYSRQ